MGKCERAVILKRSGEPETAPIDIQTLRVFWMGERVHEALQRAVEASLDVVGHELRVRSEEYNVSGKLDTLIRGPEGLEVIEYKSIKSTGFKKDLPQPAHVLQLGVYLTFQARTPCRHYGREEWCAGPKCEELDTELLPTPGRGRIIYWSKDDAKIEEFALTATDELRQNVKDVLGRLTELWKRFQETGELPGPLALEQVFDDEGHPKMYLRGPKKGLPVLKPNWQTRYCEFRGSGKCCGDLDKT